MNNTIYVPSAAYDVTYRLNVMSAHAHRMCASLLVRYAHVYV